MAAMLTLCTVLADGWLAGLSLEMGSTGLRSAPPDDCCERDNRLVLDIATSVNLSLSPTRVASKASNTELGKDHTERSMLVQGLLSDGPNVCAISHSVARNHWPH